MAGSEWTRTSDDPGHRETLTSSQKLKPRWLGSNEDSVGAACKESAKALANLGERSDEELMIQLRQGEDLALNELMRRWQQPLTRYIYRYVGNQTEAIDVAQETFVRVFQQRHRFKEKLKFSAWMFAIATNLCRNFLRWQSRHTSKARESDPHEDSWETPSELISDNSPVEAARLKESADAVRRQVDALPDQLKAVVLLSDCEELSYREIAEALGCSVKAVETRLYRAHKLLRERLRDLRSQ
jgi:RNA polymerase sigma-70 factor, ECF subfamily